MVTENQQEILITYMLAAFEAMGEAVTGDDVRWLATRMTELRPQYDTAEEFMEVVRAEASALPARAAAKAARRAEVKASLRLVHSVGTRRQGS